jgi:uncharacterized membrane protein YfcA
VGSSWFFVLCAATFGASVLSSITGGTSLITVPILLMMGLEPRAAIATNMVVVAAISGGAATKFHLEGAIPWRPTLPLVLSAVPGSVVGAMVVAHLDERVLRLIILCALTAMTALLTIRSDFGAERGDRQRRTMLLGYAALGLWSVYGGLFSGGYATVLTFGIVVFFGRDLTESVAISKVVNLFGSIAASAVFATHNAIRWDLVPLLATSAASGGWLGARLVLRSRPEQIRRLFAFVLAGIAAKTACDTWRGGR